MKLFYDPQAERDMALLIEAVTAIRRIRSEFKLKPSLPIKAFLSGRDDRTVAFFMLHAPTIMRLTNLSELEVVHAAGFSFIFQ